MNARKIWKAEKHKYKKTIDTTASEVQETYECKEEMKTKNILIQENYRYDNIRSTRKL